MSVGRSLPPGERSRCRCRATAALADVQLVRQADGSALIFNDAIGSGWRVNGARPVRLVSRGPRRDAHPVRPDHRGQARAERRRRDARQERHARGVELQPEGGLAEGRPRADAADARAPRSASASRTASTPSENIRGGVRYLSDLLALFKGDVVLAARGLQRRRERGREVRGRPALRGDARVRAGASLVVYRGTSGARGRRRLPGRPDGLRPDGVAGDGREGLARGRDRRLLEHAATSLRRARLPSSDGSRRETAMASRGSETTRAFRPAPFFDHGLFLLHLNRGKEEMAARTPRGRAARVRRGPASAPAGPGGPPEPLDHALSPRAVRGGRGEDARAPPGARRLRPAPLQPRADPLQVGPRRRGEGAAREGPRARARRTGRRT